MDHVAFLVTNNTVQRLKRALTKDGVVESADIFGLIVSWKDARERNARVLSYQALIHVLIEHVGGGLDAWGERVGRSESYDYTAYAVHAAVGFPIDGYRIPSVTDLAASAIVALLDPACVSLLVETAATDFLYGGNHKYRAMTIVTRAIWTEPLARSFLERMQGRSVSSLVSAIPFSILAAIETDHLCIAEHMGLWDSCEDADVEAYGGQFDMTESANPLLDWALDSDVHQEDAPEWLRLCRRVSHLADHASKAAIRTELERTIAERQARREAAIASFAETHPGEDIFAHQCPEPEELPEHMCRFDRAGDEEEEDVETCSVCCIHCNIGVSHRAPRMIVYGLDMELGFLYAARPFFATFVKSAAAE